MDLEHLLRCSPSSSLKSAGSSMASSTKVPDISSFKLDYKPMMILYGSNTGTCLAFALKLALVAANHGFEAKVFEMDGVVGELPTSQPIIIITASYEGKPPDNAARFISWLEKVEPRALSGTQFAVFSCGHSKSSILLTCSKSNKEKVIGEAKFQKIPTIVDNQMAEFGSLRLVPRGLSDAAKRDLSGDFDDWLNKILWPSISRGSRSEDAIADMGMMNLEISTQPGVTSLRQDVHDGVVLDAKILQY